MKPLTIRKNKKKLKNNLLFTGFMDLACIGLTMKEVLYKDALYSMTPVFVVGILYYAYSFYANIHQYKGEDLLFIIDEKGIHEQAHMGIGLIPWSEIKAVDQKKYGPSLYWEIVLENEQKTLSRFPNIASFNMNRKAGIEPVSFDCAYLDQDIQTILDTCNGYINTKENA